MAISLPDARQLSDEALQVLRLRALRGVEMGYTETDLAQLLGVCREPSAAGGPPTLPTAWTPCLRNAPATRRVRVACSPMSKPAASSNSSTTTPPKPWALTMRCGPAGPSAISSAKRPASTWQGEPSGPTCNAGVIPRRSRVAMPASRIPTNWKSGWKRPIPRSSNALGKKTPRFSGATRRVWRRTTILAVAMRAAGNRRQWRCRPPTSG